VWDAAVRTSHWLLVLCVAVAWGTRDSEHVDWHAAAGYAMLVLLAFRLAWGIVGPRHARFRDFTYSPRAAVEYLVAAVHGRAPHFTGHNPAGAWSIFGLLALLVLIALTGIVAIGGMHTLGPLAEHVSFSLGDAAREWHESLAWAALALIAFHVAGALWGSAVHHENLVAAMVTGYKRVHGEGGDAPRHRALALSLLAAAAAVAAAYLTHAASDADQRLRTVKTQKPARADAWTKECGGCHLAYAPALLPLGSWERTLREQHDHFGEDLGLDDDARVRLLAIASKSNAGSWSAWKLARSAGDAAPLRITDVRFWRHAHRDLPESSYRAPVSSGRHDCEACHADAVSGIFHPRMIRMPKPLPAG